MLLAIDGLSLPYLPVQVGKEGTEIKGQQQCADVCSKHPMKVKRLNLCFHSFALSPPNSAGTNTRLPELITPPPTPLPFRALRLGKVEG